MMPMNLSSTEIWTVCSMRMRGCTWKEVREAIPKKNIYQKFKRLENIVSHISNHGKVCNKCGHTYNSITSYRRHTDKYEDEDMENVNE
jgi:hypothetical protein